MVRDFETIVSLSDPDVEWEHDWDGASLPWFEPGRGHAAARAHFDRLADVEFIGKTPQVYLSGGTIIAVPVKIDAWNRRTQRRLTVVEAHIWSFGLDGKISRFRHLVSPEHYRPA